MVSPFQAKSPVYISSARIRLFAPYRIASLETEKNIYCYIPTVPTFIFIFIFRLL